MLGLNKKWNDTEQTGHQKELHKEYMGLREEAKWSAAVLRSLWVLTWVEWIYEITNGNVSAWPGQQFPKALYPDTANTMSASSHSATAKLP